MDKTSTRWGRAKTQIFNKVRAAGRITSYVIYACLIAVTYGYVTYPTMYALFEEGLVLEAYIYNFLTIVFWLLLEKLSRRMMALRKRLSKNLFTKIVRAILFPKIGFVSIKSGLYLFYIYVLIQAKVLQFDLAIGVSESFERYIIAMEYGLVMLVAADMAIKQLSVDHERIREMDEAERPKDSQQ